MVPDLSRVLARIGPLARAVEALVDGEDVDVPPLLSVFRDAHLAIAPGAHRDVVDTPTLVGALRRRPDLVLGPSLEDVPTTTATLPPVPPLPPLPPLPAWWPTTAKLEDDGHDDDDGADDPRGAPRRHRCARFLVDALIVGLEGEKLRHGFRPDRHDLPRYFANPDDALRCLKAVAARPVPARVVTSSPRGADGVADVLRDVLALRGTQQGSATPLHVLVGPSARAVLDLLTPSLRRLRVELALLGRGGTTTTGVATTITGIADDDDLYRGLRRLNHAAPHTVAERRQRDCDEGVREEDGLFVVDTARLVDELVDRRARGVLAPLRKQRARILGIVDDDNVDPCLAHIAEVASLQVMVRANQSHDDELPTLVQAATNTILPGAADLVSLSLPWWGLRPDFRFDDDAGDAGNADDSLHYDDGGWALWQSVNLARLEAQREKRAIARPLFRRIERHDDVDVALRALAWMSRVPDRR